MTLEKHGNVLRETLNYSKQFYSNLIPSYFDKILLRQIKSLFKQE